jgi:GT2 family glycosyltransferase
LEIDFVDFVSFNVYLEAPERLESYLARLQNLAGDRPLLMAEIGLDSRRNGYAAQALALDWQIRSVFESGCAGAIVFSWTDEWHRGGHDITDWDFGLVDRQRVAKLALTTVHTAYREVPIGSNAESPKMSVVVCSYNGSRTIADCLDGLQNLDYPTFEVIVVDDGSTDATPQIASEYGARVIRTANQGLGAARNEGMRAATGEIVAYIDDDARPDPHWLTYLANMYLQTDFVAIGGPNVAPQEDGRIAEAVAHAPGGPVHVLVTDTVADHLPGCNLTIRRAALEAIGGFDTRYSAAGDDVDVCWRLQENGGKLGFHPGAMVWHHRRNSAKAYWKQQRDYGRAEALLEEKWPERYNVMGHLSWSGRLYGPGLQQALTARRGRIYQGIWGSALFQPMYQPVPELWRPSP